LSAVTAKVLLETLATILQTPKTSFPLLQNSCKGPKGENGACRTSANVQKEKMEFAATLQAFPEMF